MEPLQERLNDALAQAKAFAWERRVIHKLQHKLDPLTPHDRILLLRKVEGLL